MPKQDVEAPEVSGMNEQAEAFAPVMNVLRGDLRDAMLDQLRGATDFSKLNEARQRDIATALDFAATEFTRKAVKLIASDGLQQVGAKLEKITVKDGLQIVCKGQHTDDALAILGHVVGRNVLITVSDETPFDGARGEAKVDPDQPELPVSDDNSDLADAGDQPEPFDAGDEELAGN